MKKRILTILFVTATFSSCTLFVDCIDGNGDFETEVREAVPFTAVANETSFNVKYLQGDQYAISVEAESNILPYIETKISAGSLEIRNIPGNQCLNYTRRPVVTVTAPTLSEIVNAGSGDFIAGPLSGNEIRIVCSGSGDITSGTITGAEVSLVISGSGNVMTDVVTANLMKATLSGSGDLTMKGGAVNTRYVVSGSGSIFGRDFASDIANVTMSGSGSVYSTVNDHLDAVISGSGNIYLLGDPVVNLTRTGSGRIIWL